MRFIGCKTLLLNDIKNVLDEKAPEAKSFCDIFSGTASVARFFKQYYQVTSNDILYFSYILQKATIENDDIPSFCSLSEIGINDPIDYLNNMDTESLEILDKEKRFFQNTYSPIGGRMYVTTDNALRIDYARNCVEKWYRKKLLNDNEYYYLLACIVEGIPFVSNISGTYGAFHKEWERRAYKKYELFKLDVTNNGKDNLCYNLDGVDLIKKISGDILYIDPPYNARQYLPNYHVLETAAKYDFPEVRGVTAQRPYENKKSDFCLKSKVKSAFTELIKNARFEHILMSYSTDGLMSIDDIEEIMKEYGNKDSFELYKIPYRRFKSRATKNTDTLSELLIYIRKQV